MLDFGDLDILAKATSREDSADDANDSSNLAAAAAAEEATYQDDTAIVFEARGGELYGNGEVFRFKGVNWFGSESRTGAPLGLDYHDIEWYMDFLKENNFNAIRVLFNHDSVLKEGKQAQIDTTEVRFSPKLFGMSYLQMFEELAKQVTRHRHTRRLMYPQLSIVREVERESPASVAHDASSPSCAGGTQRHPALAHVTTGRIRTHTKRMHGHTL